MTSNDSATVHRSRPEMERDRSHAVSRGAQSTGLPPPPRPWPAATTSATTRPSTTPARREGCPRAALEAVRPLAAAGHAEGRDPGLPAPGRGHRVVLVDIPEGAVVGGVDVHRGVVAPAGEPVGLGAAAVDDDALALRECVGGVAREPAGVADPREDVDPVGHAVAEGHVALLVLGDAAHPAVDAVVGRVGGLLPDHRLVARTPDLVPAGAGDLRPRLHQRLVTSDSWVPKLR